ncbi:MAG TPA: LAGLIDADG family homing endonuclease [Candidatus Paceibacterota bacterium]|nr:MAG: LAGLIDADG homing endonuclease [Parcubacteria group bacterium GW2011_GWA2_47_10]
MHSLEIEERKKHIRISDFERDIIVGKLLGDGHLETKNQGRTYRLKVEHSIKQKEYVDWVYGKLRHLAMSEPCVKEKDVFPPQGGTFKFHGYGFTSLSLGQLRFYGQQFYNHGKKVIPKMIGKMLSPSVIAIWYLDDGSLKSNTHRTYIIHTYGYTKSDLRRVQDALLKRFDIHTNLHRQNKNGKVYWRMYVMSESAWTFQKLIEPIIKHIPSMQYKLGNTHAQKVTEGLKGWLRTNGNRP